MKINNIKLHNFGSYEGTTEFNTQSNTDRNIVLIGGKNGAGKTTLFTAMRVCLYGYMSMGYKNYNTFYTKAISKLINNIAKISGNSDAFVSITISLSNGRGEDEYNLIRSWHLDNSFKENFQVKKNGETLSNEETADFEKYILSIIPPELFNIYFFDGEKIADFFLEDGSNNRIKNAFLVLCGYDTFDIMLHNFKRISLEKGSEPAVELYLKLKKEYEQENATLESLKNELYNCKNDISNCEASLENIEKNYLQNGGISQEEWNEKILQLKDEEKKRDKWNSMLKRSANEIVPFLMIKDQILQLKQQILKENSNQKYKNFCEIIEEKDISNLIGNKIEEIKKIAFKNFGSNDKSILNISSEQSVTILSEINDILSFDVKKIKRCEKSIECSKNISSKIREELDNSSIEEVQNYMKEKANLYEVKSRFLRKQLELEQKIYTQQDILQQSLLNLEKSKAKLEDDLKKASISDISAKSIVMIEKLQKNLFKKQIEKVEKIFKKEINILMRKKHFIDEIKIDDDFNILLYKNESISIKSLCKMISNDGEKEDCKNIGEAALNKLYNLSKNKTVEGIKEYLYGLEQETIILPVKFDKGLLSSGEKQIFIMALYYALIQLGKYDIPFIIDTPFARIDAEHRSNISKHFFSKLKGQVFILSTDEEINSSHVKILNEKISSIYMLENTDNKKTLVKENTYFEV